MPRAARVSGLLDKDFDDSWIVPTRSRRPQPPAVRGRAATPVAAVESLATPAPVLAPDRQPRRVDEFPASPEGIPMSPGGIPVSQGGIPVSQGGIPGRRTVTIRGQVARPASRVPSRTVRERTGARPDRIAMWAVLLGLLLVLVAATSSHAAVLHALAASPR